MLTFVHLCRFLVRLLHSVFFPGLAFIRLTIASNDHITFYPPLLRYSINTRQRGSHFFMAPSVTFNNPSPSAFQLWIRDRFTPFTSLGFVGTFGLAAMGFLPPFFATHANILASDPIQLFLSKNSALPNPTMLSSLQNTLLPLPQQNTATENRRFGHHLKPLLFMVLSIS